MSANESLKKSLRQLYASNRAAQVLFDEFSNRRRNRRVTTTDWVVRRFSNDRISRGDIIAMFRSLESLDCGKYLEGRKGHKSRFEWSKSSLVVCQLGSGEVEKTELKELSQVGQEDDQNDTEIEIHTFKLRPDFTLEIELPIDLSPREAERIGQFCQSLAR